MRILLPLGAGLAAAAALALSAAAPSPAAALYTVDVRVADTRIQLSDLEAVGRGPIRLKFRRDAGGDPRTVVVVEMKPGRTKADLAGIPFAGLQDVSRIEAVGRLVGGLTVHPRRGGALTIDTLARRYVVVDVTSEAQPMAEFVPETTHGGGTAPKADARITMTGKGFGISEYLPRDGAVLVRNRDTRPHHVQAIRLPRRTSLAEAQIALLDGRAIERVGEPVDLAALMSGKTEVTVERRLKPGRYVVASFYAGTGANAKPDVHRGYLSAFKVR